MDGRKGGKTEEAKEKSGWTRTHFPSMIESFKYKIVHNQAGDDIFLRLLLILTLLIRAKWPPSKSSYLFKGDALAVPIAAAACVM